MDVGATSYFGSMNEELVKSDLCRNCGSPDLRIYCASCGQKTLYYRFNLKDSVRWLFAKIFDMEQGFFHTTMELFRRPEKVIGDYLSGATRPYSHPFRFVFLWSTIGILVGYWLGTFEMLVEQIGPTGAGQSDMEQKVNEFIQKYLNLVVVAMIPFLAMWSKLFYHRRKLNFTEHIIINCYGMGAASAIGIVFNFLYFIPGMMGYVMIISVLAMTLVTGRVYARFLKENLFISALKYLVVYFLGSIVSVLIGTIIATVAMLILNLGGLV
ncbi:MAG: hypothetical protein ACI84C_001844 [Flavobacteriales bacterium]